MIPALVIAAIVALFLFMKWSMRPDLSGPEARALVEKGARLLDVRTKAEFKSGSLPKAKNIPVAELQGRLSELGDKSKPVVVFCLSGSRSVPASRMLKAAGFAEVHNLGAMHRWS